MQTQLVTDDLAACENISAFASELSKTPGLADIMSYARSWYAWRVDGTWKLGPSKFVGYSRNSGSDYIKSHNKRDGRLTERALSRWFAEVAPGSPLFHEIFEALSEMFAQYGKTPNKRFRLHVPFSELETIADISRKTKRPEARNRITVNNEVCGGRPCIRGLRIRVSDILSLLAEGVERKQILSDYPYLEPEDIDAALEYAAQSLSHRIIRAA